MRIISLGAKVDASINLQWNSILFFFHNATKVRIMERENREKKKIEIPFKCTLVIYFIIIFAIFLVSLFFLLPFLAIEQSGILYPAIINRETKSQFFGHTSDLILGNVCANVVSRRVGEAGRPTVVGRELFVRAEAMHTRAVHTQTYTRGRAFSRFRFCARVLRVYQPIQFPCEYVL